MTDRTEFLAGERPEDVAFFLHADSVSNPDALDEHAETVDNGVVLVLPGEKGRSAFQSVVGMDPMGLAQQAMDTPGEIEDDLTGGVCPAAEDDPEADHTVQFVFAFAESQNEDVGGLYAEGDVIHAYAVCSCGETYSEKWVAAE
ncbi:hypothetical protein HLRTI_002062 [Halorhabdus tiamatea SARL4B]|uniref:Uncharacterized protein n=1 Tax=Halorhabdus tiamatea SARL4B TaxID=1033806 RepID=F7PIY8_9EURY|nr:DUF5807 family protein [Halorhabdus tiamatea]ERJ05910.1 hypothetical protein HLRTI_002062 [Halorhabdus tiamatea SARL4B]CCQ32954.1 conserved hypothetical protein [Halorhabdus tiamatea SARL4B]